MRFLAAIVASLALDGLRAPTALDTGLFSRQKYDPGQKCKASALKWKKQFEGVEVRTDTADRIPL